MEKFYRYLRPVHYNTDRHVVEVKPHGGICFSLTPIEERRHDVVNEGQRLLLVSYAICPVSELFNRNVAKKLADNSRQWMIHPASLSMVDIAIATVALHHGHLQLIEAVKQVHATFRLADIDAATHRDVIESLQLTKRYHDIQA